MYRLHGMKLSGNCYKVALVLHQLNLPYEWQEVDVLQGATRSAEFLRKNPNGKVPVLELPDGRTLTESNAILLYLAEGTTLIPDAAWSRAQLYQWMFFEQYSHEPYIAVARFIRQFLPADHTRQTELPGLLEKGGQALRVMDVCLQQQAFFAGEHYSVADIALYAYTHVATDGGFDLADYSALQRWLQSVEQQPRFISMR